MQMKDLLALPAFAKARLLAGKRGLDKPLRSANMIHSFDPGAYMEPHQLLLAATLKKKHPYSLVAFVQELSKQNCAGLVVRTKRLEKTIPAVVIDACNRLQLPLFELPDTIHFSEFVHQLTQFLLKGQTTELHQALEIHRHFADVIVAGGNGTSVVVQLASMLNVPALLLNDQLDIIASSDPVTNDSFFEKYWRLRELISSKQLPTLQLSILREGENPCAVFPIRTACARKGYLIVLGSASKSDCPFALAIEQAANVLSFELMKLHAAEQQARLAQNSFFSDLVEGRRPLEKEHGEAYPFSANKEYVFIAAHLDNASGLPTNEEALEQHEDLYSLLVRLFRERYPTSHVFWKNDVYVVVIESDRSNNEEAKLLAEIDTVQQDIQALFRSSVSFGISSFASLSEAASLYKEATAALQSGYREHLQSFIKTYRAQELADMLQMIPSEKLTDFCQTALQSLAAPETPDQAELARTLSIYMNHNCQVAETAKVMAIHRNIVIYRIKKCEELLGCDLKKPDETLRLRIAFLIRPLLLEKEALL
ncbi:PucR family transcriptional regulator [Shouchella clausii]|uniref:PucR family transcriptional regulator n=1 Tax=Shouchella clausii TaxID=79880 RepID=UPI000D1D7B4E|nr:PucR family transcriptional regulator [Shouchella clausii]PTL22185.1 hypothetical protein DA802_14100 [Shouchella clausii]